MTKKSIAVGDAAPDFRLPDQTGEIIALRDLLTTDCLVLSGGEPTHLFRKAVGHRRTRALLGASPLGSVEIGMRGDEPSRVP